MIEFLIKTFNLSKAEAELFSSCFESIHYRKGDNFIRFGEKCNKIGFVKKGLLKCVLIKEEKSVIDDFAFENQFVANYYSYLQQIKSNKEIVCLKDSIISVITRKKIEALTTKHSFIEQIARQVSERLFIATAKKLEDLKLLSAEERYLQLIQTNRKILEEIPQYEIASYLNVSPETVSRIRKNIRFFS